jgi:hypothetical protein
MSKSTIRVGQRLIAGDGTRGYGMGERFKIEWLDADGEVEDAQYVSLEQFEKEGIKRGRGVMPWAK